MSEATLKRKSKTLYRNMSVGSKDGGFSLNGTRRNQGYIGRGVLGIHYPRTIMRGNEARGHGGCCGTYNRTTIVTDTFCFPSNNGNSANNDPRVVKASVLDTKGQIMTQYKWIRRPQPYAVVKSDTNMIQGTQKSYIENLSKNTIAKLNTMNEVDICKPFHNKCGSLTVAQRPRPFNCVIRIPRGWYSITKSPDMARGLGSVSQGAFINALGGLCLNNELQNSNCENNDVLPRSGISRAPLPGPPASW